MDPSLVHGDLRLIELPRCENQTTEAGQHNISSTTALIPALWLTPSMDYGNNLPPCMYRAYTSRLSRRHSPLLTRAEASTPVRAAESPRRNAITCDTSSFNVAALSIRVKFQAALLFSKPRLAVRHSLPALIGKPEADRGRNGIAARMVYLPFQHWTWWVLLSAARQS